MHLRCVECGVVSYVLGDGDATCPHCGAPRPERRHEVVRAQAPAARIAELLELTRDLLAADVALLTEITDGREVVFAASDAWPDGLVPGAGLPLRETLCARMLEGTIGNIVADIAGDERLSDLALRRFGVGSWIGVPIRPGVAELYVLCCLTREARPSLGVREVRLLSGLAESVGAELRSAVGSDPQPRAGGRD